MSELRTIMTPTGSTLGCASCALGGRTLYIVAAAWTPDFSGPPTGRILVDVSVPSARDERFAVRLSRP